MIPSKMNIKKSIKALREIVDADEGFSDPITTRMAYYAETVLRWTVENTVGWKRPEEELSDMVSILKDELKKR